MPKSMTELSEILRDLAKGKYDQSGISLTHTEHIVFKTMCSVCVREIPL